jgi:hypothetical protein
MPRTACSPWSRALPIALRSALPTLSLLRALPQASARFSLAWRLVSYSLRWTLSAPLWAALWGFSAGLCALTLGLVGLLLRRQLWLLGQGRSYLDVLAQQQQTWQQGPEGQQQQQPGQPQAQGDSPHQQQQTLRSQQQHGSGTAHAGISLGNGAASMPGLAAEAGAGAGAGPPLGVPWVWWESQLLRGMRGVFGDCHPLLWLLPLGSSRKTAQASKKQS